MRLIDRLGDAVFRGLTRLGIGPAWTLRTRGRRTGELRHTPVIPISHGGRRWLVPLTAKSRGCTTPAPPDRWN